jgi:Domain of unknown function (DUF4384)
MTRTLFVAAIALACACSAPAQTKSMSQGSHRMELTLEKRVSSGWMPVDPGLIFNKDDYVRFRFRTNFAGFLYVTNQSTSGDHTLLFPRQDTGQQNRIEASKEYIVPATSQGAFRVTGPAGHDIVYWMISPVEMGGPKYTPMPPPPPKSEKSLSSLTPRCDDAVLRARGDCVDVSAGAKAVKTPENPASRELVFIQEQNRTVVSSPAPLQGPVIYEFRLAHK